MSSNEHHSEFLTVCHKNGWKCTSQRLAVYEFLQNNLNHPDVDTVWHAVRGRLPAVTRESIYRILNEFVEKGMIRRLDHIDSARYDSRTEPHGHFLCEKCGKIFDFSWPEGVILPGELPGKAFSHMEIRLVGICSRCTDAVEAMERSGSNYETLPDAGKRHSGRNNKK